MKTEENLKWGQLTSLSDKWEEAGYEYVAMKDIVGIPITVIEYELFNSQNYGPGVRILFSGGSSVLKTMAYVVTFAVTIVNVFANNEEQVNKLIEAKVPLIFRLSKGKTGREFYIME